MRAARINFLLALLFWAFLATIEVLFLQTVRERLEIISLAALEYYSTIEEAAARGTVGGAIYDALLARCALKAGTDTIYTWNVNYFERLGPEVARRIKTP